MSYVYEERFIDAILFGEKQCPACGHKLPRTRDYFNVDISTDDRLTDKCKTCRQARERTRYAATKGTA